MSNKFKSNLLAIMVTVAPYQECHYHAGMPLEFLKECFEQFTECVCEEEFYSQTAKLGGYTEREFYNLIAVGLTNKTTKKRANALFTANCKICKQHCNAVARG